MEVLFNDDYEKIKQYLSTDEGLKNIDECNSRTWIHPLGHWCAENRSDIVDLLIASGANLNKRSILYKNSALHIASANSFINIVNSLLIAGADTNIRNYEKKTPLMCEVENKNLDIVKLLTPFCLSNFYYENKYGATIFSSAAAFGDEDIINYIFDFCNDINHVDKSGNTYLHIGVIHENIYSVKFLLDKGIDTNICNISGKTAIELTVHPEILSLFTPFQKHE